MAKPMRDPFPTDTPWPFKRVKSMTKGKAAAGMKGLYSRGTPQSVTSVRAKSQRHRKSTADRWNQ
jgi:hypothetical protein